MSRIADTFARLRKEGRPGLVTYTTAGDPDLPRSAEILKALVRAGADVLEIGVPFSDPLADGPVIQRATERALAAGGSLRATLDLVASVRGDVDVPIVIFSYVNPIVRMGLDAFAARAAAVGVDGVLALDLPIEEADELRNALSTAGIDTIFLLSPTTTEARIRKAAALGRGFLYGISRLGVTGARATVADTAAPLVERIRRSVDLPIALGFGIARPEHVREVAGYADAAVVGIADRDQGSVLAGYVVLGDGGAPRTDELRAYLRERLPDYMVPAYLAAVPSLPLLDSGKVDRSRLAVVSRSRPTLTQPVTAPVGPAQRRAVALVGQLLGLDTIGVDDDFFDLGGDSLRLMLLRGALEAETGGRVELADVLTARTPRLLARLLAPAGPPPAAAEDDGGARAAMLGRAVRQRRGAL